MNQDAVSTLFSDDDAKKPSEFKPSITPPPLPVECDLPAERIAYLCAPPILQPSNGDERPLHQMRFDAAGSPFRLKTRAWRSRTSWQTASWLGSIALHVVAFLLLALILAPADFGGTGIHSISVTLNQQVQQNEITLFELACSDHLLTPQDSLSSIPNGLLSELSLYGTGSNTNRASAVLSRAGATRGSFFGIEAGGHEFVYILDMSGSMEGRPFDRASAELMRSVALLEPNQSFYVLLFSSQTVQMFGSSNYLPQSIAATKENKERLAGWLRTAFRGGGTDPREALQIAMRINPSAIFMLSDGEFNGQKNQKQAKLLGGNSDAFAIVAAAPTKPPIHAIAFENTQSRENMKRLAEMTEGEFQFVEQRDRTNPEVAIRQVSIAMQQGDHATAGLFLREAVANLEEADSDRATQTKIELGRMLFELAENGLKKGELDTARMSLEEMVHMDPKASLTEEFQSTLVEKLLVRLQSNSDHANVSEITSLLSEFVERFPHSAAAQRIRDPLARVYLNEARQLYCKGDSLQSIQKLETVLATFSDSEAVLECRGERDRIAEELLDQAQQLRQQQGDAASAQYLRRLVAVFEGTQFQHKVNQALEELAREMLVAARDATFERDQMTGNRIQQQLEEEFGDDRLLNRVRRELAVQERKAQVIFLRAIQLEQLSQTATALVRYRTLVQDYSGTLAAQRAQDRLRVLGWSQEN